MSIDFLYSANEWLIQLTFFALMMAVGEVGFRWGRRATPDASEKGNAQVSVIEGSLLGVLGLLLGFTMSMAASRFETRKQLVLDEANAIGTAYLRTQLLPARDAAETAALLRDYLDIRIRYVDAGEDPEQLTATRRKAQRLQERFWAVAIHCAQTEPGRFLTVQLLQSLNQVIDLEAARWMAFFNRVPSAVICTNAVVALFGTLLAGYAFGIEGARQLFSMCLLSVASTVVFGVILDLDRPRHGFIRVSQQPLIDLQLQLREGAEKAVADPH